MGNLRKVLIDAEFMIREELEYMQTGKHPGVPMRDCRGQWQSLLRDIQEAQKALAFL